MIASRGSKTSSSSALRRSITLFVVVLIHAGLIFGPLCLIDFFDKRKPKQEMFRVRIGGAELSGGPRVGMPERIPPRPPAPQTEPAVPPPPKKAPAEPRMPVVKPKVKPTRIPKKKTNTAPKPKAKPRPEPRMPVVKPKAKPGPEPRMPVVKPKAKPRPDKKKKTPRRRNPMDEVYKEPSAPILNPKVPVGKRNRSQQYAPKADDRTPGGGRKVSEETWSRYGKNVERYIYSRWVEPPRSLLGGFSPETLIEITVAANGKVTAARVARSSGNRPMESSVQALLAGLDLLPQPPEGPVTFRITLKTR